MIDNLSENLKEKLSNLPNLPGIYQFKNETGKVIYVGKAKILKNRVRSYFHSNLDSPKTRALVSKVTDLELIVTDSEIEALMLENNLIKELKPKYNVNLKDDKSFPYIRVTNEPFPQVFPTRTVVQDGSKYFGPFTDVKSMRVSLRMISRLFKVRSCKYFITDEVIEKRKIKVCLDYHIKRCEGPCEGLVSKDNYGKMINNVIKLLKGKTDDLINDLSSQMIEFSQNLQFEKAAEIRDRIEQLKVYDSKHQVISADLDDKDIIAVAVEDKDVACTILNIKKGKLLSKRQFHLFTESGENLEKIYSDLLRFYYSEYVEIPKQIITEVEPSDLDVIISWLSEKAGRKPNFIIPKRKSDSLALLNMSKTNANLLLKEIQLQKLKKEGSIPYVLNSLKRDLRLKKLPVKIECFDISNLQGTDTVASMVVFENGKPKKSEYRKYIINSVEGPDDFASMQEVISRRYSKLLENNEPFPELIMVDGGKGQLSSAIETLDNIGAKNFQIIGLAKRLEEVFLPNHNEAQSIPKTSSSLKLLQHIRDEAHRFAITFHRDRRNKRTFTSEIIEIEGIGSKTAEILLKEFKSINEIKSATIESLSEKIGNAKARIVFQYFNK